MQTSGWWPQSNSESELEPDVDYNHLKNGLLLERTLCGQDLASRLRAKYNVYIVGCRLQGRCADKTKTYRRPKEVELRSLSRKNLDRCCTENHDKYPQKNHRRVFMRRVKKEILRDKDLNVLHAPSPRSLPRGF